MDFWYPLKDRRAKEDTEDISAKLGKGMLFNLQSGGGTHMLL